MSQTKTMKAWTHTHGSYPKALNQTGLPADTAPLKPSEIRIRTKAVSINPVDAQLMGFPLFPYIPNFIIPTHKGVCEDFSGVVEESGKASGYKAGDEVFGAVYFLPGGTLQETIRIDTNSKDSVVLAKPADWSFVQAAAVPLVWLTAQSIISLAEPYVKKNGKVAILGGSSSSGMYATYLAKERGWTVIASCSGKNADFVRSFGADEIIDYTTESVSEKVKAFAADAIIDCVGGAECVGLAKRYITIVGDKTHRLSMGGRNTYFWNPQQIVRALRGKLGLGPSYTCINVEFRQSFLDKVSSLPLDKVIIDSTFSFKQVRDGFERVISGRARGKVVVTFDNLK